jgi:Ni/Co efflux regulator RcnB
MLKKLLVVLLVSVLALPLASAAFAEDTPAAGKEGRWEGHVIRSSKDQSTLTVRKVGSQDEKTVMYDSSTRWVSQEHGSKKVNDIDVTQVKDGDRVICKGKWDKDGVLHATLISKRLTGM